MPSQLGDAERIKLFLNRSKSFDELVDNFDDEFDCYETLRDAAKDHLRSFDEYLRFYEICIEDGPTGLVYSELYRNAERSLKNMVTRGSDAGQRYPITSLAELDTRVQKYQDLGVDKITTEGVISTVLEHLYENEHDIVYEVCDNLLAESARPTAGAKLLTHARFVSVATSLDRDTDAFENYLNEFISDLPDPYPDDDRSGDALWSDSEEAAYSEPQKLDLAQASVVRQPDENRVAEYLYLDAVDVVERYRHAHRDQPMRAELQLCIKQINVLQSTFSEFFTNEQRTRLDSYLRVALAQEKSGKLWGSQQDERNRSDPDFRGAAAHFYKAAQLIKPIDETRFLKYFSKAVRSLASAATYEEHGTANGWAVTARLHEISVKVLLGIAQNGSEELNKTVNETVILHRCLRSRAEAVIACYNGTPEKIRDAVNDVWEMLDTGNVPVLFDTDFLKALDDIADALESEQNGAYAEGTDILNSIDRYEDKLPLSEYRSLLEIKSELLLDEYQTAQDIATTAFEEQTPIRVAATILAGEKPPVPRLKQEYTYPIIGVNDSAIWSLSLFLGSIQYTEESAPEMRDQLEQLILDL
ncbi:hypothetical protein [Halopenitus persicus]|uniref:hypothetical protein n=1 Tax=Halopenitus persicus TaxID=1048396 RepID=UPI000BBA6A46|nr:hypothetical protein [Halopenitus persicus]